MADSDGGRMRHRCFLRIVFLCLFCHSSFARTAEKSDLPKVMANNNRTPAGQLANGVLELRLTLNEAAGAKNRLRYTNITPNASSLRVRLTCKDAPVQWKVVAKDGADLPPAQLKSSAADMGITVRESYDVEYQQDTPGFANLQIWLPVFPVMATQPLKFVAAK
jgi:hypothetical protein